MFKLVGLSTALILFVTINPSLAKGKKPKIIKVVAPAPTQPSKPNKSDLDSIPADIRQIIETAKKYRGNQSIEKSQLETQQQYEARIAALQPSDVSSLEISLSPKKRLIYNANDQAIIISLDLPYTLLDSVDTRSDVSTLRVAEITRSKVERNITCTNGFGASFNYQHTSFFKDQYGVTFKNKESFSNESDPSWADAVSSRSAYGGRNYSDFKTEYRDYQYGKFAFKLPMTVDEVRSYITTDEKNLNEKLKFIVKIKPVFPFYKETPYASGDECGGRYDNRGGTSMTFFGTNKYAIVDISSLKLVDTSTGKILLERDYSGFVSNEVPELQLIVPR